MFLRPLRRALELGGFEVLTAGSGEEALDCLKTEDVDLVLTDQRLPGMNGVSSSASSRPSTRRWPSS